MPIGPWRVLRQRDYAVVWGAGVVSDLGTWMQIAALGIFVAETTHQAGWVGVITTVTYLSLGLSLPLGGVLADRYDRRRVVMIAVLLQAFGAAVLTVAFVRGLDSPLALALIAGIQGTMSAAVNPSLQAMVPDLVPLARIPQTAFLAHVSWNLARAAGPALAVVVIELWSYQSVFIINGLSFLAVAAAMGTLRKSTGGDYGDKENDGGVWRRISVGFQGLGANVACRWACMLVVAEMILAAPFLALIPVMSQLSLHGDASDTGRLFVAQGVGSALGVILLGSFVPRFGQAKVFLISLSLVPAFALVYAASSSLTMAVLFIAPLGGVHSGVLGGATSLMQHHAPEALRGRILALSSAFLNVGYALSSWLQASIVDRFGIRSVLWSGAGALAAIMIGVFVFRPDLRRQLTPADEDPSAEAPIQALLDLE